jgi:hypothetical protein
MTRRPVTTDDLEGPSTETDGREIARRRAASHSMLEALFRGRSRDKWRAMYAGAYDWGPDVGSEVVEK